MIDIQLLYKLITIFLYSLFATYLGIYYIAKKSEKFKYVVEDKYKKDGKKIPTMGGIGMLIGILISLALSEILNKNNVHMEYLFTFYFIVIVYALYGIIDDLFAFKRRYDKIIILLVLSFPIATLITSTILFGIEFGAIYSLIMAPVYIMVVSNLINVYSGFNGLAMGLSLILLITITIKSFMVSGLDNLIYVAPLLGALVAFFPFNFYPAKLFEGNVGAFLIGSGIGALLIINKLELFGIFILIPHIINFILDTWILAIKKVPDIKFGELSKDGKIIAPTSVKWKSIKYILCSYFRITERQAVLIMYGITIIFCVLGVWLF